MQEAEAVKRGKEFIANASHELRTPITVIRGFAETLHEAPNLSSSQIQEITGRILKTSLRLDSLIKSLLALTDIEHLSEEPFRPVDLSSVADNCRQLILAAHSDVQIEIHSLTYPIISADSSLIEIAVMNLLENAVKYSPAPGHIEITIDSADSWAYLMVKDHGIGISDEDQGRIFDRFFTVDKPQSRRLGGSGLGLSIVKTIVQKHLGTVSVASKLGEGSTFTIQIPTQDGRKTRCLRQTS